MPFISSARTLLNAARMKTIQAGPEQESQRFKPRTANFVCKRKGRKQAKDKSRDMTCLNSGQGRVSGNGAAAIKKTFPKPKKLTPQPKLKLKQSAEVNEISQKPEAVTQINDKPVETVLKSEVMEVCQQPETAIQVIDKPTETVHTPTVNNARNGIIDKILGTYQSLKYGSRLLTAELENLLIKKHSQRESLQIEPPAFE